MNWEKIVSEHKRLCDELQKNLNQFQKNSNQNNKKRVINSINGAYYHFSRIRDNNKKTISVVIQSWN